MKRYFSILLYVLVINQVMGQVPSAPPFGFQSNSNLKVRISPNIISPETWINFPNYLSNLPWDSYRITDYYEELKHQNGLQINNPVGNEFFNTANWAVYTPGVITNPFINYYRDSSLIWHYGKFFFDGQSDIGIDSGIVLKTGRVFYFGALNTQPPIDCVGPTIQPGISHKAQYTSTGPNLGMSMFLADPTNPQLPNRLQQYPELVALNNGLPISDANIFEFDVVPYGNFISLDYVFASEEWPQNTCDSGADVMAIMISGPGISGQKNIALLPNSNTPVTTHTVYPPNTGCFEQGGSPYYIDNTNGENVIYNGFTKVLRAASIVQPCQTYHIKVMVAEGTRHPYDSFLYVLKTGNPNEIDTIKSDSLYSWVSGLEFYDSGVFLKMGSLKSMDTVTIQALGGLSQSAAYPYAMKGCFNAKFRLTTTDSLPIPRTYTLQYGGTAISGVDY